MNNEHLYNPVVIGIVVMGIIGLIRGYLDCKEVEKDPTKGVMPSKQNNDYFYFIDWD
jgi:hypothetical protein